MLSVTALTLAQLWSLRDLYWIAERRTEVAELWPKLAMQNGWLLSDTALVPASGTNEAWSIRYQPHFQGVSIAVCQRLQSGSSLKPCAGL